MARRLDIGLSQPSGPVLGLVALLVLGLFVGLFAGGLWGRVSQQGISEDDYIVMVSALYERERSIANAQERLSQLGKSDIAQATSSLAEAYPKRHPEAQTEARALRQLASALNRAATQDTVAKTADPQREGGSDGKWTWMVAALVVILALAFGGPMALKYARTTRGRLAVHPSSIVDRASWRRPSATGSQDTAAARERGIAGLSVRPLGSRSLPEVIASESAGQTGTGADALRRAGRFATNLGGLQPPGRDTSRSGGLERGDRHGVGPDSPQRSERIVASTTGLRGAERTGVTSDGFPRAERTGAGANKEKEPPLGRPEASNPILSARQMLERWRPARHLGQVDERSARDRLRSPHKPPAGPTSGLHFESHYQLDDEPYDEVHPIVDRETGDLIGACGISAVLRLLDTPRPRYYAFSIWVHAYASNETIKTVGIGSRWAQASAPPELVAWAASGTVDEILAASTDFRSTLQTHTFRVDVTIDSFRFGSDAESPRDSYFANLVAVFDVSVKQRLGEHTYTGGA